MTEPPHRHRAITTAMVGLASGSSRVSAALRPRAARLAPLTRPSVEPGLGTYVMARDANGPSGIALRGTRTKEGHHP